MQDKMYTELSSAKLNDKVTLVISDCSKGGYTIAQKVKTNVEGRDVTLFLKGAIVIEDTAGLISIRDALNEALEKV